MLITISVTDRNKTCRILVGLLVRTHRLTHVFDWHCKTVCINFFLENHIVVFKITSSSWWYKLPQFFFWILFHKSPNSLYSCYSFFSCNKMLPVSFLSVSKMYIFFWGFLSHTCVTPWFLLIFKNLLITCCRINKQMKTSGKNNLCITTEWNYFV